MLREGEVIVTPIWRLVIFLYSLVLLAVSGAALVAAMGMKNILIRYIDLAYATPQNRMIAGVIAIIIAVIAVSTLLSSLKRSKGTKNLIVVKGLMGDIVMSIPAIKVIISKAVKKIEGVKDVESTVKYKTSGLFVTLHTVINPEMSVPELSQDLQNVVKEDLEVIGGLQVAEIKVFIDHAAAVTKTAAK